MKRTKRLLALLGATVRVRLSSKMVYRFSFWTTAWVDLLIFMVQMLFFRVIAQNGAIGGWTADHLTVFLGTFIALDGFYMGTYFFGVIGIPERIRSGQLDLALLKPVDSLFYVAFGNMDFGSFPLGFIGLLITYGGAARLGVLSLSNVVKYFVLLFLMYWLMFALMICFRSVAFWLTEVRALNDLESTMVEFSYRMPGPAYQGLWRLLFFVILPYGLMATMPAQALFGVFGLKEWALCLGVTAFFLMLARWLWQSGLRRYDSASC